MTATDRRRVLVTGAGGFVGGALASGFAALGWEVIGLDRTFEADHGTEGVRRVVVELTEGLPAQLPEVELVLHAAWVTTDPETLGISAAEYIALNMQPLLAVLEYTARTRPAAFVFLSSSGVFGASDGGDRLTDADSPSGRTPYAAAKRASELLVDSALATQSTEAHVVRLGYLFGPDEDVRPSRARVSLVADWVAAALASKPLLVRSDDPRRDWTFTPDLASAIARVIGDASAGHPIHLGSGHVCTDGELASLITAQVPGATIQDAPATRPVKPPMAPSDVDALRGFEWTHPAQGIRVLLAEAAA